MRQADYKQIRALPLFSDTSEPHFQALMAGASLQHFLPHSVLITEGQSPEFLHVIVDGCVEMFGTHNGHETTIDIMQPGAAFILAEIIHDAVYLKSARTLGPAQLVLIPVQAVRDAFAHDAAFARAIISELVECYRGVVRSLKNEKLRTSAERLANWILHTDAKQGHQHFFEMIYDKRTLASSLGMTPENLSRNLALLTKYGVTSSGRDIAIKDPAALVKFAKPNPLIDG